MEDEMNYRESKGPEQRGRLGPRGHTPKTMLPCAERLNAGNSNQEEGLERPSHRGHEDQGSWTPLRTERRMKVDVDRRGVLLLSLPFLSFGRASVVGRVRTQLKAPFSGSHSGRILVFCGRKTSSYKVSSTSQVSLCA